MYRLTLHILLHPSRMPPHPRPRQHPPRSVLDGALWAFFKRCITAVDLFHPDYVLFPVCKTRGGEQ